MRLTGYIWHWIILMQVSTASVHGLWDLEAGRKHYYRRSVHRMQNLKKLQDENRLTELMVMQEELKTFPFGDVWTKYCEECGVPADKNWFAEVERYEKEVLLNR